MEATMAGQAMPGNRWTPASLAEMASRGRWKMAPHLAIIDDALLRFTRKVGLAKRRQLHGPRLMILAAPRHGKSRLVSEHYPAWLLLTQPNWKVMLVSYQDKFSTRWGRKARQAYEWFIKTYDRGVPINPDVTSGSYWALADPYEGEMNSIGMRGSLVGKGTEVLVIDDIFKNIMDADSLTIRDNVWDLYQSALNRLEPGGGVLVSMHRWHTDDLKGRLLQQAEQDEGVEWEVLRMAAVCAGDADDPTFLGNGHPLAYRNVGDPLWPDRVSLLELQATQREIDRRLWMSLFQQDPRRAGGNDWSESFFDDQWFDAWPGCKVIVAALDPSKGKDARSGDYSAIVIVGYTDDGKMWVEADLERRPTDKIVRDCIAWIQRRGVTSFVVEANQFQELLADKFYETVNALGIHCAVRKVEHTQNKIERIRFGLDPLIVQKRVMFKRGSPGTKILYQQILDFPTGAHDDGCDALEAGIQEMKRLTRSGIIGISVGRSSVAPSHQAFQQRF